jgi:hypothetical protein
MCLLSWTGFYFGRVFKNLGSLKYVDYIFTSSAGDIQPETSLRIPGKNTADAHFVGVGRRAVSQKLWNRRRAVR